MITESWKTASLDGSKANTQWFLETHMALAIGEAVDVITPRNQEISVATGDKSKILFHSSAGPDADTGALNITTFDSFHTGLRRIGKIAFKAMLGQMAGKHLTHAIAGQVTRTGRSFWAYMGFLPLIPDAAAHLNLSKSLQESYHCMFNLYDPKGTIFPQDTRRTYDRLCQTYPLQAWRAASQCKEPCKEDGMPAGRFIFDVMRSTGTNTFTLLPAETTTRQILETRLGPIPTFRKTDLSLHYPFFCERFAQEKADTPSLARLPNVSPLLPLSL